VKNRKEGKKKGDISIAEKGAGDVDGKAEKKGALVSKQSGRSQVK